MVSFFAPMALAAVLASTAATASAFQPTSFVGKSARVGTSLGATVDPDVVTKKEYEDICGVSFDDKLLSQRLERTKYLYPKHVEVIEDIAPIADQMVDDIVSCSCRCWKLISVTFLLSKKRSAMCPLPILGFAVGRHRCDIISMLLIA